MNTLLVLGGSSDIAKAIAHRYAKAGWNIVLAGRNPKLLSEDARDIEIRYRVQGRAVGFDVLKPSAHGKLDRKSTRLNSSHIQKSRMPSSA